MQKLILFLIVSVSMANCNLPTQHTNDKMVDDETSAVMDTFHLLCQYWELDNANNPTSKDISLKMKKEFPINRVLLL